MREIDETLAIQALHNEIEVYFEVAVKRKENLWSVKKDLEGKANLFFIAGVLTKQETDEQKEKIAKYYRKSVAKQKQKEFCDLDVGF